MSGGVAAAACSSSIQSHVGGDAVLGAETMWADASSKKCKCIEADVQSLKKRKVAFEKDVESLLSDADSLTVRAEKETNVSLITKSNAMRRAAKEKADELAVVIQQLDVKLLELKNCP